MNRANKLKKSLVVAFVVQIAVVVLSGNAVADDMWPLEFEYGACVRNSQQPDVLVWTPPNAKRVRAVLLIIANTDSKHFGEYEATRKVAAEREMGIVYLRCGEIIDDLQQHKVGRNDTFIQSILETVAKETGIAEYRYAPWIPFGKSSMGRFPFWLAWAFPDRTVAAISYHGETPTWPPAQWALLDDQTIPYVNVNGETEWGGTWNRHVRPSLLNYRSQQGWLAHQVVAFDVGHGNYPDTHGSAGWGQSFPDRVACVDVWDYLALFIDKAVQVRVPTGKYPTQSPVVLNSIDESTGVLIDPFAVERLFEIPRQPLQSSLDGYIVDPAGDKKISPLVTVPSAKDLESISELPISRLDIGRSPARWLVTPGTDFAIKDDPMRSLGELQSLRPRPGTKVELDGIRAAFQPIDAKHVRREGGINLRAGLQPSDKCTFLAYTVLDVPKATSVKVNAPFTQNGRVQLVLNGALVAHEQVINVEKGLYPMLVAVRLRTKWQSLHVSLDEPTVEEIKLAIEAAKDVAESQTTIVEDKNQRQTPLIEKAKDVDPAIRKNRFWVMDQQLADQWLRLHTTRK